DGENFFNREKELEILTERVHGGVHTLLSAQRRMGKTSLVRELLRQLNETGNFSVVFVDLEAAGTPSDAIAEIGAQTGDLDAVWGKLASRFRNFMRDASGQIEEMSVGDIRVKLRAGINLGNWQKTGDAIFAALADSDLPVVLAIDELPILLNRMLKDRTGHITPQGREDVNTFMSWLRKTGQSYRGQVTLILSGSVSLEPLLEAAGLSAQANIFSSYDLKPWSMEMAVSCLGALAKSYDIDLSLEIRRAMCKKLRCHIPHHVQIFFDKIHDHLRDNSRNVASIDDVEQVYAREMLGVRGQFDLQHYEERLKTILGEEGYPVALEILTAASVDGNLSTETLGRYRTWFSGKCAHDENSMPPIDHVLHVLQYDGYLELRDGVYHFVSGLLEDWWRRRYGQGFVSVFGRQLRGQEQSQ
ncbi:MAG: hypothetical protein OXC91_13885, partial [Rhodobacteraceae bacterium]|nr:hypothetical protein [Paracoccaceae bacterium]